MRLLILLVSSLSAQFTVPKINKPQHPQAQMEPLPERHRPDEATLKAEYAKTVSDVGDIIRMANEVKVALDKADHQSLPADAVKMLGDIERRAKQARRRFKQ